MYSSITSSPSISVTSTYPNIYNPNCSLSPSMYLKDQQHGEKQQQYKGQAIRKFGFQNQSLNLAQRANSLFLIGFDNLSLVVFAKNIASFVQSIISWVRSSIKNYSKIVMNLPIVKMISLLLRKLNSVTLTKLKQNGFANKLAYYLRLTAIAGAMIAICNQKTKKRVEGQCLKIMKRNLDQQETNVTDEVSIDSKNQQKSVSQNANKEKKEKEEYF